MREPMAESDDLMTAEAEGRAVAAATPAARTAPRTVRRLVALSADDILASVERFCAATLSAAQTQATIAATSESGH
jgi:hypothetical protein